VPIAADPCVRDCTYADTSYRTAPVLQPCRSATVSPALGAAVGSFTLTSATYVCKEINITGYVNAERAAGRAALSFALQHAASVAAGVTQSWVCVRGGRGWPAERARRRGCLQSA